MAATVIAFVVAATIQGFLWYVDGVMRRGEAFVLQHPDRQREFFVILGCVSFFFQTLIAGLLFHGLSQCRRAPDVAAAARARTGLLYYGCFLLFLVLAYLGSGLTSMMRPPPADVRKMLGIGIAAATFAALLAGIGTAVYWLLFQAAAGKALGDGKLAVAAVIGLAGLALVVFGVGGLLFELLLSVRPPTSVYEWISRIAFCIAFFCQFFVCIRSLIAMRPHCS